MGMIFTVTLNPSIDRTLYFSNLKLGEVNRAQKVLTNLGGKGVNVSLALHNLGVASVMMGLAGGTAGELFIHGLSERGLECDFTRISGEMRSNITAVDLAARQTTKLNEPGPRVSPFELERLDQQLAKRLKPGDMVILSGSLPPGAPVDTYARLIHLAKSRGALCALDSSGDALVAGCRAQPEWIKPNIEEAAYLTGLDMNRASWQEALLQIK
ncbi:MAG: PfkB family carbohydrate kinase, partial [Chloroflexi bacterium]|nr:PfkB family carbohydrate kinase [Chloroflexota bacterium]